MADIRIGLPFVPFGIVALAATLVIKVFRIVKKILRNSEDVNRSYRSANGLALVGTLLNAVECVFVVEPRAGSTWLPSHTFDRQWSSWRPAPTLASTSRASSRM